MLWLHYKNIEAETNFDIKIQPKTRELSTRLRGITTEFVGFIPGVSC